MEAKLTLYYDKLIKLLQKKNKTTTKGKTTSTVASEDRTQSLETTTSKSIIHLKTDFKYGANHALAQEEILILYRLQPELRSCSPTTVILDSGHGIQTGLLCFMYLHNSEIAITLYGNPFSRQTRAIILWYKYAMIPMLTVACDLYKLGMKITYSIVERWFTLMLDMP